MGFLTSGKDGEAQKETFAPASSFIATVDYDEAAHAMDITFHSGSKIRYIEVYPSTFLSFKQSPTHSAFYARAIKGNLPSVHIVQNNIGQTHSLPLKQIPKEKTLDTGLRQQQAREQRVSGTVQRAINAAAIG